MDVTGLLAIITRAVALASIVLILGSAAFALVVLTRLSLADDNDVENLRTFAARVGARAAGVLVVVAPVRLYLQARRLVDAADPVTPMARNVLRTVWGRGWNAQTGGALIALVGLILAARRDRRGWVLAVPAALAIAMSPALMGHAVAAERFTLLSVFADWLHVMAASAWIGGVSLLTLSVWRMRDHQTTDVSAAGLISAFHPLALSSAAVLFGSGMVSLFLRVGSLRDLLDSSYGAVLGLKLGLTGGVVLLGRHHARSGARLASQTDQSSIMLSLVVEVALAALVLVATAVLVGTAPPVSGMTNMN